MGIETEIVIPLLLCANLFQYTRLANSAFSGDENFHSGMINMVNLQTLSKVQGSGQTDAKFTKLLARISRHGLQSMLHNVTDRRKTI